MCVQGKVDTVIEPKPFLRGGRVMAAELVNEPEPSRQSASLLVGTYSSKRLHRTASNNLESIEHRQPQFNDKRKSKNQHTPPILSLLRSSRLQLPHYFHLSLSLQKIREREPHFHIHITPHSLLFSF